MKNACCNCHLNLGGSVCSYHLSNTGNPGTPPATGRKRKRAVGRQDDTDFWSPAPKGLQPEYAQQYSEYVHLLVFPSARTTNANSSFSLQRIPAISQMPEDGHRLASTMVGQSHRQELPSGMQLEFGGEWLCGALIEPRVTPSSGSGLQGATCKPGRFGTRSC